MRSKWNTIISVFFHANDLNKNTLNINNPVVQHWHFDVRIFSNMIHMWYLSVCQQIYQWDSSGKKNDEIAQSRMLLQGSPGGQGSQVGYGIMLLCSNQSHVILGQDCPGSQPGPGLVMQSPALTSLLMCGAAWRRGMMHACQLLCCWDLLCSQTDHYSLSEAARGAYVLCYQDNLHRGALLWVCWYI